MVLFPFSPGTPASKKSTTKQNKDIDKDIKDKEALFNVACNLTDNIS